MKSRAPSASIETNAALLQEAFVASSTPTTPQPKTVEVTYTDQGFSPQELSLNLGDTVTFTNTSTGPMWVGSDAHPTHVLYSGTTLKDHCPDTTDTAFDQCSRGDTYSFTFTKAGTWKYHNHSKAAFGGTIEVK